MMKIVPMSVVLLAFNAAGCGQLANSETAISDHGACELVKTAVSAQGQYENTTITGCDFSDSDDAPKYYILRLNGICREKVCGSVLMGWYAVEKSSGRVFEWDVADWSLADEVIQDNRRYLKEYDPYIADAKQRWSAKNQFSENPFKNRTTSVVTLDDRICVSFEYSQPDIGGLPPFYCYSFDGVELISKRDDVE